MKTISEIWIYPIKSLGGISVLQAKVEIQGLQYDRRWMLVNEEGRFMSQREIPEMALLRTAIDSSNLSVFHKNKPSDKRSIPLEINATEMEQVMVEVWGDKCLAAVLPTPISDWFSDVLGQNLRLVVMPESTRRWADQRYAPEGQHVSFADGYPFLLLGQATLDDLNNRMEEPLPMNRFRPNFVFSGGVAFEEDSWGDFRIGETLFRGVKPCARCSIPTTDQETAEKAAEPLKTLATYRKFDSKINFGQNVLWLGSEADWVSVGDRISVAP